MRTVTPRRCDIFLPGEPLPPHDAHSRRRAALPGLVAGLAECVLLLALLGALAVLAGEIGHGIRAWRMVCGTDSLHWLQGCPPKSLPWRNMTAFALLGLLAWWPLIRGRVTGGRWP